MIGVSFQDNAVFDMNIVDSSQPFETFLLFDSGETGRRVIPKVKEEEYSEIGTSSNIIPLTLSLNYNMLSKFGYSKWMYQNDNIKCKHFEEMEIHQKMEDKQGVCQCDKSYPFRRLYLGQYDFQPSD